MVAMRYDAMRYVMPFSLDLQGHGNIKRLPNLWGFYIETFHVCNYAFVLSSHRLVVHVVCCYFFNRMKELSLRLDTNSTTLLWSY